MNHFSRIHLPRAGLTALVLLLALLAAGCAPSVQDNPPPTLQPAQPTPAPTLAPTPTPAPTLDAKTQAEQAAADLLAKTLDVPVGDVKLTDIQPVQWPDSCLGVPQAGILCAMHVVDGYRLTLAAQGQAYEAHSNLDGSQVMLVPGPLPPAAGISFTVRQGAACTSYIFHPDQGVIFGPCGASQKTLPFVDSLQQQALQHYLTTYQSFTADTPQGFVNFAGSGGAKPTDIEQRSIAAWAQITASEAIAGRSNAADGLVIGWHREGGLAGFCDDLSVYETGMVSATSCKNGIAQNKGISWLTTDQLAQLYHWLDGLARFEYAPPSQPGPDAINVDLIFSGKGSAKPSATDQQDVESFAEVLEANLTGAAATPTSTPAATASAAEVRIQFAAGATAGVVEGNLQPGQTQDFVLTAAAGQPLIVMTGSYNNDVTFSVSGKKDGKVLLPASQKSTSWQTLLTVSQDYLIRVIAGAITENFSLNVITPARIQFATGTDSIVEKGSTPGGWVVSYILRAGLNQHMTINLEAPDDAASLTVYGFQDGQPYLRSVVGSKTFDMKLPATQDYVVQVVPNAGQVTDYTLHITVK